MNRENENFREEFATEKSINSGEIFEDLDAVEDEEKDTRFRFGVAKFGSRKHSALTISVPGGIALAAAISAVLTSIGPDFQRLTWAGAFAIMFACMLPPCVMAIWIAIVDRETIRGADQSPEYNVENTWLTNAAATTGHFTFAAAGIGSAIAAFALKDSSAVSFTLLGVCYFMVVTFAVAYFWERRR
ncbi:MAG: hypothetical protein QM705_11670 [Ancrocorticia sp.]